MKSSNIEIPRNPIETQLLNAEDALDKAIKAAVEAKDIALAERIRNAAFHVSNIVGVRIRKGEIKYGDENE